MDKPSFLPNITTCDVELVNEVFENKWLSQGEYLEKFEKKIAKKCGRKYAVGVNSGTSALHIALLSIGIKEGDEVITTPYTFIATVNAILYVGATPVFVDIDKQNLNMNFNAIKKAITSKTKAIIPVDVYGNLENMNKYEEIAEKYKLYLIEDSCEALGAKKYNRYAGSFGICSVFGFYPNKQITTGEGGMLLTDDKKIMELAISFRNHGRDVYSNDIVRLGFNYKMSDINAALGISQLNRLDYLLEKRLNLYNVYNELLKGEGLIQIPKIEKNSSEDILSIFTYVIHLNENFNSNDRDKVILLMKEEGIICGKSFPSIHLLKHIVDKCHNKIGDFPNCEYISERSISLPFYVDLSLNEVNIIVKKLKKCLQAVIY